MCERKTLHVPEAMCEAYDYPLPSAFSRGMEVALPGARLIFVSGTASVGPLGESLHPGNFSAQARCQYFQEVGIAHYPASTCIEARLCRDELLVEMDMTAIVAK